MILYKYLPAERIDILENLRIRFTQPNAMNDPFEARPDFYITEEGQARELANVIRQVPLSIFGDGRTATQATADREAYADRAERDPNFAKDLIEQSSLQVPNPELVNRLYQLYNHIGILSLSETSNNLLMWAHYAVGHTGFVLEFDSSHDFFKTNDSLTGFAKPIPVEYKLERPRAQIDEPNLSEIFFIKGSPWKYEREWRYLKYLNEADVRRKDLNNLDANLFRLPPKCIVSIILGCYRVPELENKILALRCERPELQHLRIHRMRASTKHYQLEKEEIEI